MRVEAVVILYHSFKASMRDKMYFINEIVSAKFLDYFRVEKKEYR